MTLRTIIDIIRQDGSSWIIVFIIISSLIEFTPIKLNPISFVLKWICNQLNKDVLDRIDKLETKLDEHINESDNRDIRLRREHILDFGNSCMNGRRHTKEEFDFIISECDKYETHCIENSIPNGVAKASIKEIRRIYENCIKNNSFLQEGVDYGN